MKTMKLECDGREVVFDVEVPDYFADSFDEFGTGVGYIVGYEGRECRNRFVILPDNTVYFCAIVDGEFYEAGSFLAISS